VDRVGIREWTVCCDDKSGRSHRVTAERLLAGQVCRDGPVDLRELRFRQTCKAHTNHGRFSVLQRGAHAPARQIPDTTDGPHQLRASVHESGRAALQAITAHLESPA
jgi:hypothetical protein